MNQLMKFILVSLLTVVVVLLLLPVPSNKSNKPRFMIPQWLTSLYSTQQQLQEPFNDEYQEDDDADWVQVLTPDDHIKKSHLSRQERRAKARLESKEKKRQARALRRGRI